LDNEIFPVETYDRMPLYTTLTFQQNKSELVKLKLIDVMSIQTKLFRKQLI
jgi:DNA topoisomerase IA